MHPLISDDAGTTGTGKFNLELNAEYANDNGDSRHRLPQHFQPG